MRNLQTLLEYEAKRRPEIADMMNRITELSLEDIDNAKVPLPWFRKALKELRERTLRNTNQHITEANLQPYIIKGFVPDIEGRIFQYTGDDLFMGINRGQLLVKYGELFFLPDTGGIWIDTIFASIPDNKLLSKATLVKATIRSEYSMMVRENRSKFSIGNEPMLGSFEPAGPLAAYGVRFSR